MTLLSFSLPPESGEKLHLGVTILLSMTVFLVQLGKILPGKTRHEKVKESSVQRIDLKI